MDRYTWGEFHALTTLWELDRDEKYLRSSIVATTVFNSIPSFGKTKKKALPTDHFVPKKQQQVADKAAIAERWKALMMASAQGGMTQIKKKSES